MFAKEGKLTTVLSAIAGFLLLLCIILASIQWVAGDKSFYEKQFKLTDGKGQDAYQRAGMEHDELWRVTDELVDYLFGRNDTLQTQATINGEIADVYSKTEIDHMVDVQKLMKGAITTKWLALALGLSLLLFVFLTLERRFRLAALCKGYLLGMAAFFLLALAVGLFALLDFDSFFTLFHRIFFSNDLWILDSRDFLIQIVPQMFFENFVARVAVIFGLTVLLSGLLAGFLYVWRKNDGKIFTSRNAKKENITKKQAPR